MEPINKTNNAIETKTKNRDAQKKQSSRKVRGVSPEAGRESMVERFVKEVGFESGLKERDGESDELTG